MIKNSFKITDFRKTSDILFSIVLLIFTFCCSTVDVFGQGFVSGSTGSDGAFSPTANITVQVPESGVFNYTTFNIPSGVTVKYTPNSQNTPVTILTTGNVTIAGIINLDGEAGNTNGSGGKGGPGGWKGGTGGFLIDNFGGMNGDGRGGGIGGGSLNGTTPGGGGGGGFALNGNNANNNQAGNALIGQGGAAYGVSSLLPLTGGSGGGGGGSAPNTYRGGAGGGGGGAILIASSGTITLSNYIYARGGNGAATYGTAGSGGGGAGGAVRLVANTITGAGYIDVRGGGGGSVSYGVSSGGTGSRGFIKFEAFDFTGNTINPNGVPVSTSQPNPVTIPSNPLIRIASIAGVTVPLVTRGSLQGTPDLTLPGALTNPVTVQLEATNLPVDSVAQVIVTPPNGARTVYQATPLTGTTNLSTATASISIPPGMSVITVSLTVNLQTAKLQPIFIEGERIKQIEVATNLGGESETIYITEKGKRLKFPVTR